MDISLVACDARAEMGACVLCLCLLSTKNGSFLIHVSVVANSRRDAYRFTFDAIADPATGRAISSLGCTARLAAHKLGDGLARGPAFVGRLRRHVAQTRYRVGEAAHGAGADAREQLIDLGFAW